MEEPDIQPMPCPCCSQPLAEGAILCTQCGFDLRTQQEAPAMEEALEEADWRRTSVIDKAGRFALVAGFVAAGIACCFPTVNFMASYLVILIHEAGHAILGFLFGYPALPAFDFVYGGGVTLASGRIVLLVWCTYGILAWFLFLNRNSPLGLTVFGVLTALFALLAHTQLHHPFITFMGHGFEMVIAVTFLYRAMCRGMVSDFERPVYAFCGFFIWFYDLRFAFRLLTNAGEQYMYRHHPAGHLNDFVKISERFGVTLGSVTAAFLGLCLLVPLVSYMLHRYREHW